MRAHGGQLHFSSDKTLAFEEMCVNFILTVDCEKESAVISASRHPNIADALIYWFIYTLFTNIFDKFGSVEHKDVNIFQIVSCITPTFLFSAAVSWQGKLFHIGRVKINFMRSNAGTEVYQLFPNCQIDFFYSVAA